MRRHIAPVVFREALPPPQRAHFEQYPGVASVACGHGPEGFRLVATSAAWRRMLSGARHLTVKGVEQPIEIPLIWKEEGDTATIVGELTVKHAVFQHWVG
jgi:hypothetical protein